MKTIRHCILTQLLTIISALGAISSLGHSAEEKAKTIPFDQLGAEAGKDYHGDGLSVTARDGAADLCCDFQKLRGHITREGLWLESSGQETSGVPFRIVAQGFGRDTLQVLPATGEVETALSLARFVRPGVVEEYSVSVDGVRQDFLVNEKPAGTGPLRLELAVDGGKAESAPGGANLTLDDSGRKIAYQRLNVTDATGQTLTARIEVISAGNLALVVDDTHAAYPVRIDPTFSDADWVSLNPGLAGVNSFVNASVLDGSGNLFIGGTFNVAGTVSANCIAKWNGSIWTALGTGVNGSVYALAVVGTNVYAGGEFTNAGGVPANYIAKWNGSDWTALGSGMNSVVNSLAISGSDVYAGGGFTIAGGVSAMRIAKWNGTSWTALGSGMTGSQVNSIAISSSDLYAGGRFTNAGGVPANNVAKWNGTAWTSLGTGINNTVNALAANGTTLYAGGSFTTAGGVSAVGIAKWNGVTWTSLGTGLNNPVRALLLVGTDLYVGGGFTITGTVTTNGLAKWNGSAWSTLGSISDYGSVYTLVLNGTKLYIGGNFNTVDGTSAHFIAGQNNNVWAALGAGMDGYAVNALTVSGANLYVGGDFTKIGGISANCIAKWNGSAWSALGAGMSGNAGLGSATNSTVSALALIGSDLYAGGDFTTAGGVTANSVAKWNGSAWSACNVGVNGRVYALAASGTNLYAGGFFTMAGGISANMIAKWNGTAWSSLGTGINGGINALAVSGSNLYAGGLFTTAGGVSANYIAKWNGSAWSGLGSGMNSTGYVSTLAISGTDLYAGGEFATAGGITVNRIAKWNGTAWSALGTGMNSHVHSMVVSGGDLFAGGAFSTAGGVSALYIAKWNGTYWTPLGTGMDSIVYALTRDTSNHLFVGGHFSHSGTTISPFISQANLPVPAPDIAVTQVGAVIDGVSSITCGTVNAGSSGAARTFIIANTGDAILTSLAVTKDGPNAADFTISALSSTSIAVGSGNATFTVTFSPTAGASSRTAAIHIASNVTGTQNPFDITLTGTANNAPTDLDLSATSVAENVAANTTLGTLGSTDPDAGDTITYSLAGGAGSADNAAFTINSVALKITNSPDFEAKSSYAVRLRATDSGGLFFEKAVTITILDLPETPTDITAPVVTPPADVTVMATSASGAMVDYPAATATDAVGVTSLTYSQNSGTLFPIGSTVITTTATDAANNVGSASFVVTVTQVPEVQLNDWATSAGLSGADAAPTATPFSDGIVNLLKYAFNMNAAGPDVGVLTTGGTAGLPQIALDNSGSEPVLRVAFLRRKGSGLIYTAQRSSSLGDFLAMTGTPTVTSIDAQWERVSVEEPFAAATGSSAFARVQVSLP